MSLYKIQMTIEVDDEALAEWIPESERMGGPYTTNVREWYATDVFHAAYHEIIEPNDCDLVYIEEMSS